MTDTGAVMPAAGTRAGTYHWVRSSGGHSHVVRWEDEVWFWCGVVHSSKPGEMAQRGWTYVGPVREPEGGGNG